MGGWVLWTLPLCLPKWLFPDYGNITVCISLWEIHAPILSLGQSSTLGPHSSDSPALSPNIKRISVYK